MDATAITAAQLARACGCSLPRAENWLQPLVVAMDAYWIDTRARRAPFLAQVAHESGRLAYLQELWGPTLAQKSYEGRLDLGNVQQGDGYRYRGRGLIQLTGRTNYAAARDGMRRNLVDVPDFERFPELLEVPRWAALSAAWFWHVHHLNELADSGDFVTMTRRINGGTNGLQDREALWDAAKAALA